MAASRVGVFSKRLATMADLRTLVGVVAEAYWTRPITFFSGVPMEDCLRAAEAILPSFLSQGHTWISESDSKDIVTFMCCSDLVFNASNAWLDFLKTQQHFRETDEVKAELEREYATRHGYTLDNFPRGHTYYLKFGGTPSRYQNQGFSRDLYNFILEKKAEEGYLYGLAISSNRRTRRDSARHRSQMLSVRRLVDQFPDRDGYAKCTAAGHDGFYMIVDELKQ